MITFKEWKETKAPRWIQCISWARKRQWLSDRFKAFMIFGGPALVYWYYSPLINPYARQLQHQKPKTDEERLRLKRFWSSSFFDRDWEMGEYAYDVKPKFDVYTRRKQYPEHYGDQYENRFKKYEKWL